MSSRQGRFIWYDLVTTDLEAAKKFYAAVVGWEITPSGNPGMQYLILHAPGGNELGMGGMMPMPDALRETGMPTHWSGYTYVDDVDATAKALEQLGGKLHRPPEEIPHIGRFAVVSDPQGAPFYLFKPDGAGELKEEATPGYVGWRELHTTDPAGALAFYSALLGWKKDGSHDMGPHGTYDLVGTPDGQRGGMMRGASSSWLFYFNVASVEAAIAACTREGGQVLSAPHQQPEGGWIARCRDSQGGMFAVSGGR